MSKNIIASKIIKEVTTPTNKGAKYTCNNSKTKGLPTKTSSLG